MGRTIFVPHVTDSGCMVTMEVSEMFYYIFIAEPVNPPPVPLPPPLPQPRA